MNFLSVFKRHRKEPSEDVNPIEGRLNGLEQEVNNLKTITLRVQALVYKKKKEGTLPIDQEQNDDEWLRSLNG